jgi:hypothetical protein
VGITGTDVSKEAADMVHPHNNFASIAAVEEACAIFANIRKSLRYRLSSNIGEVMTMLFGVLVASMATFEKAAVTAAHHRVEDESRSPAISESRVAGAGLMFHPLAAHLGYSRVARGLQRVKFIVGHLGDGRNPRKEKRFGITSR